MCWKAVCHLRYWYMIQIWPCFFYQINRLLNTTRGLNSLDLSKQGSQLKYKDCRSFPTLSNIQSFLNEILMAVNFILFDLAIKSFLIWQKTNRDARILWHIENFIKHLINLLCHRPLSNKLLLSNFSVMILINIIWYLHKNKDGIWYMIYDKKRNDKT